MIPLIRFGHPVLIILFIRSFQCEPNAKKPNIVIFIADDLGYGDVGINGNTTLPTPNIDKIGQQGATLTHHLAAASVCTPSRAALLTGRYPVRYGMTSSFKNRVFFFIAQKGGLPEEEITFPEVLQAEGYSTALIGKWHLGYSCSNLDDLCHHPLKNGFDYFYGLPLTNLKDFGNDDESVVLSNHPNARYFLISIIVIGFIVASIVIFKKWYKTGVILFIVIVIIPFFLLWLQNNIKMINSILMSDNQVIEQPVQLEGLTERFVTESKLFITKQSSEDKPFLLMFNFVKVHTAHFPNSQFKGKSKYGLYGDCVMELDWGVGEILDYLEELKIKNNTLVYFSSDNGGHLEELDAHGNLEGGYNGLFRGGKGHGAMEGGIRVPTALMWPNIIPPNSVIDTPTSQLDLLPTIYNIIGKDVESDRIIDGKNILPMLKSPQNSWDHAHKFLFHYCGIYLHGVRYVEDRNHIWKLYYYTPNYKENEEKCDFVCQCYGSFVIEHDPPLLYNIATDPEEKVQLNDPDCHNQNIQKIVDFINTAVKLHEQTLNSDVESQFSLMNSLWNPWLQPCCPGSMFPYCSCLEKPEHEITYSHYISSDGKVDKEL